MKDTIKTLVLAGTSVKHAIKFHPKSWISEITLGRFSLPNEKGKPHETGWLLQAGVMKRYREDQIDKAVNHFGAIAYHPDNLANALKGVYIHNMTTECLDDLTDVQIQALVGNYKTLHFAADFPWAQEFRVTPAIETELSYLRIDEEE